MTPHRHHGSMSSSYSHIIWLNVIIFMSPISIMAPHPPAWLHPRHVSTSSFSTTSSWLLVGRSFMRRHHMNHHHHGSTSSPFAHHGRIISASWTRITTMDPHQHHNETDLSSSCPTSSSGLHIIRMAPPHQGSASSLGLHIIILMMVPHRHHGSTYHHHSSTSSSWLHTISLLAPLSHHAFISSTST